ncbi:YhbY family RNA-binding protein, partial [Nanoarchaeota archaeon]
DISMTFSNDLLCKIIIHINKQGLIKIKLLRSFAEQNDRKKTSRELAAKVKARLVEQVGLTIVLYKNVTLKSRRT